MNINLSDYGLVPHKTKTIKVGQVFGKRTVLAIGKNVSKKRAQIVVKCSCGSPPKVIDMPYLRDNRADSCGCITKKRTTIHGFSRSNIYTRWHHMMQRCYNPKHPSYPRYGARNITVCKRWHDPEYFIKDMLPTYKKCLHLEREDNDKGYSPNNCTWATRSQQAQNKCNNHKITFQGKTLCLSEWVKLTGINYMALRNRIKFFHWPIEKALTTKLRKKRKNHATSQSP